jgi:hypothetical protein
MKDDIIKVLILMYFKEVFMQFTAKQHLPDELDIKVIVNRFKMDFYTHKESMLNEVVNLYKQLELCTIVNSDECEEVKCMLISELDKTNKHRNRIVKLINELMGLTK